MWSAAGSEIRYTLPQSQQPCAAGTLFGPSNELVEDPSGVICPFADATGQWLPLLCTIKCAGALQQVGA